MTVARGYGQNGQAYYTNITKPMECHLQFTVTPTNGLGVTSVKSNGFVNNVFMNTSTTPASNNGFLNPDPLDGFAVVQFPQNFNKFIRLVGSVQPPTATSTVIDNSVLVIGQAYVITVVGNATAAQWAAVGVPAGVTPAVGVSFIAKTVGPGGNALTSRVQLPTSSPIVSIEVVGNSDVNVPANIASNAGEYLIVKFAAATSSSVTTLIPTAPAAGSIVSLSFLFDGSTVGIGTGAL